jgi:hypothetical protein
MKYYSYKNDDTGEWQGLLRYHDFAYDYVSGGKWVAGDPDDVERLFFFPGADGPELLEQDVAEALAARSGVTL